MSSLVVLTLPGGAALSATVTNEGLEALGLKVGAPATAVFKAYSVMVAAQPLRPAAAYTISMPPSSSSVCPVMPSDSAEAR